MFFVATRRLFLSVLGAIAEAAEVEAGVLRDFRQFEALAAGGLAGDFLARKNELVFLGVVGLT